MDEEEHPSRTGAPETGLCWMTVPESATHFRVPKSRMYALINSGDIPAVRIGRRSIRVSVREVERFLAENRRVNQYPG